MHATSSPKAVNFQPAILAAVAAALFIAGIALGSVMDLRLASTPAAVVAPDTSYNAIEGARAQFGVAADTSYNAIEDLRAQSGVTVPTEFDVLHAARAKAAAAAAAARAKSETKVGKSGFPSTRDISKHDVLRGAKPASDAGLSGNTSETRSSTPSNGVVIPSPTNWLAE